METMYPGKINSPATTLNGAINNSVTTINVVDGSVLPTAPNLAVIGTGEDAETILYGVKTANELSTVTRGFQGTAKAWDTGIKVARMFTEKDYASLKSNVTELAGRKLSDFAVTTSAELAGVISDETGTDKLVYSDSPVLTTQVTAPRIIQTNAIENTSKLLQTEDIFSDYVVTGLLPATSANLISDISAGHAYVTGVRVNKTATSKTYTASVDTYVDVNSAGTYTFPEVALGATAPAVTADSIRLAKVVTDADNITGVTDLRKLTLTLPAPTVILAGGQIAFPAAQAASAGANVLDDYEEGDWTPAYTSTDGTFTYATQSGKYTKIGRVVFITFYIKLTSVGGTKTNSITVTGLPFTGLGDPNIAPISVGISNYPTYVPSGFVSGTSIILYRQNTITPLIMSDVGTDTYLVGAGCYHV